MKRLTSGAAMAAALVLAACSDGGTDPDSLASEDDYALVMFGDAGSALENTLGPQGARAFDGRTGVRHLPDSIALTAEQRAAIAALREAFRAEHQADLDALRDIFERAHDARAAGASREEVRAILQEGRALAQALHEAVEALHAAIRDVFTDEQLAWLDAHRRRPPRDVDGRHHRR
jgi:hypothetical protein